MIHLYMLCCVSGFPLWCPQCFLCRVFPVPDNLCIIIQAEDLRICPQDFLFYYILHYSYYLKAPFCSGKNIRIIYYHNKGFHSICKQAIALSIFPLAIQGQILLIPLGRVNSFNDFFICFHKAFRAYSRMPACIVRDLT